METSDIINLIAILIGPVISLGVSIIYQERREEKKFVLEEKNKIFETIYKYRDMSVDMPYELVNALNMIDIVYRDNDNVISAWEAYLNGANDTTTNDMQILKADLLSEMSMVLGYNIKPTKIWKTYMPNHLSSTLRRKEQLEEQMRIFFTNQNNIRGGRLFPEVIENTDD